MSYTNEMQIFPRSASSSSGSSSSRSGCDSCITSTTTATTFHSQLVLWFLLVVIATCSCTTVDSYIYKIPNRNFHNRIPRLKTVVSKQNSVSLLSIFQLQQQHHHHQHFLYINTHSNDSTRRYSSTNGQQEQQHTQHRQRRYPSTYSLLKQHGGIVSFQIQQQQQTQPMLQPHRPLFPSTGISMSRNNNNNNDEKSTHHNPKESNYSFIEIGAASVLLLLLLSLNVFDTLPSFVGITITIVLFILLRTIASTLILDRPSEDSFTDADTTIMTELNDTNEIRDLDTPMIPLQWQIDGTTLILSYFITTLLVPSSSNEIASDSTFYNPTWPSMSILVAIIISTMVVLGGIWFQINIVLPTIEKEKELLSLSWNELLFYQWDQKLMEYLKQQKQQKQQQQNDE